MMMKTLLLGAAAGLVTVGVAQAADLPMTKAEPVEYVKVCNEFGEGFFYIPGTDTCLKLSGEVRADYRFQSNDGDPTTPGRDEDRTFFRTRAQVKWDARTATEYGTLRSFVSLNANVNSDKQTNDVTVDRAFIQFGGLTAGYAHTFFGIFDADYANNMYFSYYTSQSVVNLLAYTAVFGGGFSATLSVEDGHDHRGVIDGDFRSASGVIGNDFLNDSGYGGQRWPDIVGNLRIDQGWGEAAIFGAAHDVRSAAFDPTLIPVVLGENNAGSKWGYAFGAGVGVNLPFWAGGHVAVEGTYAKGATNYLGLNGIGEISDSIVTYNGDYGMKLGHGWGVTGEIGADITPAITANLFGTYVDWKQVHDDGLADFSPDLKAWGVGGNVWYTIVKGLKVALEVDYNHRKFNYDNNALDETDHYWNGGVRILRTF